MIRPSFTSLRICWRELALAISLVSLGSSHTFFCHSAGRWTPAASEA
uniref:Uncharacterized protein n=1 Tax=Anguilla anguilla TaxID=7936 RepID=A0A0E9UUG9_ANGAN